jgi:hypothetical protein
MVNLRFEWTGVCESCGEPSNRYDFKNRPSRSTLVLYGPLRMASGRLRRFPEEGKRIEVCYRCKCRWRRNQNFESAAEALGPARERALKLARTGTISGGAIARALGVRQSTVWTWLREAGVSTPTPMQSYVVGSKPRRRSPKKEPAETTS